MKRKIYLFLCILTCAAFIAACGKDSSSSDEIPSEQESTTSVSTHPTEEDPTIPDEEVINPSAEEEPGDEDLNSDDADNNEVPVGDASDSSDNSVDTSETTETPDTADDSTTDAQKNVSENPTKSFKGSGTFNGFVDSSSIEVTMADGTFQTFFVYDEDITSQLEKLAETGDAPTIKFTYQARDGQINPEITALH